MQLFNKMFFSIGAMKSGTSWLYEMLKEHPGIEATPVKEVHYFWELYGDFHLLSYEQRVSTACYHMKRLLPVLSQTEGQKLLNWIERYLNGKIDDVWFGNLFEKRSDDIFCSEFSNMYSSLPPDAWNHVKAIAGTVKIIYILRKPLDRLWSHVRFHAKLVGQFDKLQQFSAQEFDSFMTLNGCLKMGKYHETLSILQKTFHKSDYMACTFDSLFDKPAFLLHSVEKFLGINHLDYTMLGLKTVHNRSPEMIAPPNFYLAALPHVETEMGHLQDCGFDIPNAWTDQLDQIV